MVWPGALIFQAVADSQRVNKLFISLESHETFAKVTLIVPNHLSQQLPVTLYLGHDVNEVHYSVCISAI